MGKRAPAYLPVKSVGALPERCSAAPNFINQAGVSQFAIINMNEQGVSLIKSLSSLEPLHESFLTAKEDFREAWSEALQ